MVEHYILEAFDVWSSVRIGATWLSIRHERLCFLEVKGGGRVGNRDRSERGIFLG